MPVRGATGIGRRRLGMALLALPLAGAATLVSGVTSAPPADAGRIKVSDTRLTSTSETVTISVRLGPLEKGKLGITPPGGTDPVKVDSGRGPGKLSYTLSLSCPDFDGSCLDDGRKEPAPNGKWTATFDSRVLVLGSGSESKFVVDAPPDEPAGVTAKAPSADRVKVRWRKGAEPDLSAYKVSVGGKNDRVSVGPACGSGTCSASLPAPAESGHAPVSVKAVRDGHGGQLSSSPAKTTVDVPAPARQRSAGVPPGAVPSGKGSGDGQGAADYGNSGGFPSPGIGGGGAPDASLRRGAPPDPYPSFGTRPEVAPATSTAPRDQAANQPAVRPLSYGTARGDAAVSVALALVLILVGSHVWLWRRTGRRRPALPGGLHRAIPGRRRR